MSSHAACLAPPAPESVMSRLALTIVILVASALLGCGGGSGGSGDGDATGTYDPPVNTITAVRLTGTTNQLTTVFGTDLAAAKELDDDPDATAYDVTIDLPGPVLPTDPRTSDLQWALEFTNADPTTTVWDFTIQAEE